jgi:GntR family transcriptional regulator, transcriptional repressor for pyruvate dehydrogenase complex
MFQSVLREPNLTGRVAAQLEALIVGHRLQPGDHLPAMSDLARQFGVSRTVIREAIGALAAKGLLEVRHGARTTVRHPSAEAVTQSMARYLRAGQAALDIEKVSHVRRVLEVEIAGCAAAARTAAELARLESLLQEMTAIVEDRDNPQTHRRRYVQIDVEFHATLAHATGNELFPLLLNSLADILLDVRELGFDVVGSRERALEFHRAIFEQVQLGNVEGARQAMHDHLVDSEAVMRQAVRDMTNKPSAMTAGAA